MTTDFSLTTFFSLLQERESAQKIGGQREKPKWKIFDTKREITTFSCHIYISAYHMPHMLLKVNYNFFIRGAHMWWGVTFRSPQWGLPLARNNSLIISIGSVNLHCQLYCSSEGRTCVESWMTLARNNSFGETIVSVLIEWFIWTKLSSFYTY